MLKKIPVVVLMLVAYISIWISAPQKENERETINSGIFQKVSAEQILRKGRLEHSVSMRVLGKTLENEKKMIVSLSQDECDSFKMLTYAESGIEKEDHQLAVAATILNRMESEDFSDDFYGVMNQKCAFSSVRNGKIYLMTRNPYEVTIDMVPDETSDAVIRALEGEDPTETLLREEARRLGLDPEYYADGGALYFYNPDACGPGALSERENIKVKVKIGAHYYYKIWG